MKLYGMQGTEMPAPEGELVLNANSAMIKRLSEKVSSDEVERRKLQSIYSALQRLHRDQLNAEELKSFLAGSFGMLDKLI